MYKKLMYFTWVTVAMSLTGCGESKVKTIRIDGHVFDVPKEYFSDMKIPWLPASQSEGLKVFLNPNDSVGTRSFLSINSTDTICHSKLPKDSVVKVACDAAAINKDVQHVGPKTKFEKVSRKGSTVLWEYQVKNDKTGRPGPMIAYCHGDNGENGLCTALSNYGDLVFSVSFDDKDIDNLYTLLQEAHNKLAAWERRR